MLTIERYHDISCGHRVHGHESKCAHLHGHNYRITFTCTAPELDALGRVIDFSVIKQKLCMWLEEEWDHRFLLWVEDPFVDPLIELSPDSMWITHFNPTAEAMAQYLVDCVGPEQLDGTGVTLVACRVEETRKCSATYSLPNLEIEP